MQSYLREIIKQINHTVRVFLFDIESGIQSHFVFGNIISERQIDLNLQSLQCAMSVAKECIGPGKFEANISKSYEKEEESYYYYIVLPLQFI